MHFHFEIEENGFVTPYPAGEDLPDAKTARREALLTLGEMVKDAASHSSVSSIVVRVSDAQGRKIVECSASVTRCD